MTAINKRTLVVLISAVLILLSAQVAFAYDVPDCVTLGDFEVCFQGVSEPVPDPNDSNKEMVTWYYSIEGTGGDDSLVGQGLSHWTLELCSGYSVVEPVDTFETLAQVNGITSNEPNSEYEVELGPDNSTPVDISGIKYNSAGEQIDNLGDLQIFSFTTSSTDTRIGDTPVLAKWGQGPSGDGYDYGMITGPVCGTTAVTMTALSAASEASFDYSAAAAALVGLIALVPAVIVIRRRTF